MSLARSFQVVAPPFQDLKVYGPAGISPDINLLNHPHRNLLSFRPFGRAGLPKHVGRLLFVDENAKRQLRDPANFYGGSEFFLVSLSMRDFLLEALDGQLESSPVEFEPMPDGGMFAAMPMMKVDCIDDEKSLCGYGEPTPFYKALFECELPEPCWEEFANAGPGLYRSYPTQSIGSIKALYLKEDAIPPGATLFQATNWPGVVFGEREFLKLLESKCSGGTPDYYFWSLSLPAVGEDYRRTQTNMR